MREVLQLGGLFLLLLSCSAKQSNSTNSAKDMSGIGKDSLPKPEINASSVLLVDKIYLGMPIDEMKSLYKNAEFRNEPVFKYGVDGEEDGILVIENNDSLFFVWTMQGENTIAGITVLSPKIIIDEMVHVGMTYAEFGNYKPGNKLAIDMISNIEFGYVADLQYRVEFITSDSNRVAEYNTNTNDGEPEFVKVIRPNAKIERISL